MIEKRTHALVLRSVDYRDTDRILTLLTPEEGKLTVTARGCRKRGSPLAAAVQILTWSDFLLSQRGEQWSVREAALLRRFPGVEQEVERLSLGCYFAQAAEVLSPEGMGAQELLSLTLNSLHVLDRRPQLPLAQVKACFEFRAMCLAGYEPGVEACGVCGAEDPRDPGLHLRDGVLHCGDCRAALDESISMPLDAPALDALRHIVLGDPKRLFSFRIPPRSLELLSHAAETYLTVQLERGFHTLDFYKRLTP